MRIQKQIVCSISFQTRSWNYQGFHSGLRNLFLTTIILRAFLSNRQLIIFRTSPHIQSEKASIQLDQSLILGVLFNRIHLDISDYSYPIHT